MFQNSAKLFTLSLLFSGTSLAIEPVYEGTDGVREQVFASNCLQCHASDLIGAARNDAPFSVDFDTYEAAKINGPEAIVESVDNSRMPPSFSGIPSLTEEQEIAILDWQDAGFPRYSTQATYDSSTQLLTLPVVLVGESVYRATLRLVELTNSPLGFGFKLETAVETTDSSENATVYDESTGLVSMPDIALLNSIPSENVSAEMEFVPKSNPLLFSLKSVD